MGSVFDDGNNVSQADIARENKASSIAFLSTKLSRRCIWKRHHFDTLAEQLRSPQVLVKRDIEIQIRNILIHADYGGIPPSRISPAGFPIFADH